VWICGLLYILVSTQLCPPSRHFQYTEVLLLLWNGYLSGWGCFICRRGWQEVGGCGEFFYWWQNSISSEWLFFYTTTLLLLDDMVDTLKNHIHFNHRNWQVAYSPFSPGLRVEVRGEISSRMHGFTHAGKTIQTYSIWSIGWERPMISILMKRLNYSKRSNCISLLFTVRIYRLAESHNCYFPYISQHWMLQSLQH